MVSDLLKVRANQIPNFCKPRDVVRNIIAIRKSRKIDLPDAIIAATAIVNDYILITHNTKDFENIQNIKILNSFDL